MGVSRTPPRACAWTVSALLLVVLGACEVTDPFADYRGVNLITERGASIDTFAEAYGDGSDPATTYDYITITGGLTAAEYGSTSGLPAGAESTIRRVEIPNLIANGDFEATAPLASPAEWDLAIRPPTIFEVRDATTPGPGPNPVITNRSVYFSINPGDIAEYDLATLADTFVPSSTYFFGMDFRRDGINTEVTVSYSNGVPLAPESTVEFERWTSAPAGGISPPMPVESVPSAGVGLDPSFASPDWAGSFYFSLGSLSVGSTAFQSGYLDNVIVGRLENLPHLDLTIPVSGGAGLAIVPGEYDFSVFVKSEIDAQVTPTTLNAFRAEQILLGKDNTLELFTTGEAGWSASEWAEVTTRVTVSHADIASGSVMLQLTLSQANNPTVGRLLIAEPTLELVAGG